MLTPDFEREREAKGGGPGVAGARGLSVHHMPEDPHPPVPLARGPDRPVPSALREGGALPRIVPAPVNGSYDDG